jgi:coproporphyrinogen III oxidase-like Fe-S oxidoreductase
VERLDQDDHIGERLMLGLRVIAGLPRSDVNELLSNGLRASDRRAAIERHLASGHLQWNSDRLCLTKQGIMIADSVFVDLL